MSIPRLVASCLSTASPMGERQMLPRQTTRTDKVIDIVGWLQVQVGLHSLRQYRDRSALQTCLHHRRSRYSSPQSPPSLSSESAKVSPYNSICWRAVTHHTYDRLHRIYLAHLADQEDPVHLLRLGFRRRRQTLVEEKGATRSVTSSMMAVSVSEF